MSPITRSITSLQRMYNPNFPTHRDLDAAYNLSVPRIKEDAKRCLEMILESDEIRELYNPISEEYWFVNNIDALNQVVLHEQLSKMMDGISTDYALYSGGGRIIPHLTSRAYEEWPSKGYQKLWGMLTQRNVIKSNKPEMIITPNVNVGECWCFNGDQGQIAIRLSRSIIITHITYTHIGKDVAIDPLSKYKYDLEGKPTQTFNILENHRIRAIMIKILNNHENPKFTCLYRLQVHGNLPL
ncbi:9353_t:CDS:2 [Diversispora eburnea]|uniref:9353_t:CDS:1 n=2 Tax=Diversisporales TaxID=214509 RepID=A0A9N8V476_9GLOM|nr:9353_t:CDS:2 [Diversispora eburnea]